jgi:ubiquinone/menaquinone biosynthesis C-methylase UbiE
MDNLGKKQLQEVEYYLPYHWLVRRGAKEVQLKKMSLVAAMLSRSGLKGGNALDIGCGDGKHTFDLQNMLPDFHFSGADFSERAITYARMLAPQIPFYVQDGTSLQFADASFDAIVSIEVIEHIPVAEVPLFLQEIKRLLKPGGVVVLTTPTTNRPVDEKHFQHFSEASMRKYLGDAGFQIREMQGFGLALAPWLDTLYRYIIDLPMAWRLQKHVQGKWLKVSKANGMIVCAQKAT